MVLTGCVALRHVERDVVQSDRMQGPNDEKAKEILDFAHHMYLLTLDHKLFLAPITDPQVAALQSRTIYIGS